MKGSDVSSDSEAAERYVDELVSNGPSRSSGVPSLDFPDADLDEAMHLACAKIKRDAIVIAIRAQSPGRASEPVQQRLQFGNACWCAMVRLELWSGVGGEFERLATDMPLHARV